MNVHKYDDYLTVECADGEFTFSYGAQIAGPPAPEWLICQLYDINLAREHLPALEAACDIGALSLQ